MKITYVIAVSLLLFSFTTTDIPPTNKKVLEYVNAVIGKTVDRGECWDLANAALNHAGAKWEPPYGFGKLIDYKKEQILPGDIMQLNNVTIESVTPTSITKWKMAEHTAVLYEVIGKDKIKVAEQNVNKVRKVMISEWNLADVKSGKIRFYRPQGM